MRIESFLMLILICSLAVMGAYYSTIEKNSISAMIRFAGICAFFLLCTSLILGPLAVIDSAKFARLIEPRRAVGLASFVFLLIHFGLIMDNYFRWDFAKLFSKLEVVAGLIGLILFVPLVITSCDYALKKLGAGFWKKIQYLTYVVFVFVLYHYIAKARGPNVLGFGFTNWNWVELFLILFACATIALQAIGFYKRTNRR